MTVRELLSAQRAEDGQLSQPGRDLPRSSTRIRPRAGPRRAAGHQLRRARAAAAAATCSLRTSNSLH